MCQQCINLDKITISHRAVLKDSASLQKLKTKLFFKLDTYCSSGQKAMAFPVAFKIIYYFSPQSSLNLLNLVLSSMKWILQDPKQDLQIEEAITGIIHNI